MNQLIALFGPMSSRKFLVVIIASILLWFGRIDQYTWVGIIAVYLGVQGTIDAKNGKAPVEPPKP